MKKIDPPEFKRQILFDIEGDVYNLLHALAKHNGISMDECAKGIVLAWVMETGANIQDTHDKEPNTQIIEDVYRPRVTLT